MNGTGPANRPGRNSETPRHEAFNGTAHYAMRVA